MTWAITAPVCAPSRSSIITGVHPGTLGTHQMRTGMKHYEAVPPPDVKCFTEYLRAEGYYCSNHTKTDYQFAPPFTAWNAAKGDWRLKDDSPAIKQLGFKPFDPRQAGRLAGFRTGAQLPKAEKVDY